jgi:hypothetical protein
MLPCKRFWNHCDRMLGQNGKITKLVVCFCLVFTVMLTSFNDTNTNRNEGIDRQVIFLVTLLGEQAVRCGL